MKNETQALSTPMAILEAALEKERAAYHFYDQLLKNTNVGLLQEIIEHLIDEEYKHVQLIEKKIAALRSG